MFSEPCVSKCQPDETLINFEAPHFNNHSIAAIEGLEYKKIHGEHSRLVKSFC